VSEERLLDLAGKGAATFVDPVELDGQLGDDPADCRLGLQRHGLSDERTRAS
jgi:hypothetical protein